MGITRPDCPNCNRRLDTRQGLFYCPICGNTFGPVGQEEAEERRVVNETTGGEKGSKLARFDLLPWEQLWEVAKLYGKGAEKYEPRNWERGFAWSLSYAALVRHLALFWGGEKLDAETQCHHLASVIFHALALMYFEEHHPLLDDRPRTKS